MFAFKFCDLLYQGYILKQTWERSFIRINHTAQHMSNMICVLVFWHLQIRANIENCIFYLAMTKTFGQLSIHIVLIKFVLTSVHVDPEIVAISGQLIWQRKHFASYSHIYLYIYRNIFTVLYLYTFVQLCFLYMQNTYVWKK